MYIPLQIIIARYMYNVCTFPTIADTFFFIISIIIFVIAITTLIIRARVSRHRGHTIRTYVRLLLATENTIEYSH